MACLWHSGIICHCWVANFGNSHTRLPSSSRMTLLSQCPRVGHISVDANYCETDVLNTYRVWLRYELFRGRLTESEHEASERNLEEYIKARSTTKPHLNPIQESSV